jgi:hypothetical protein
VRASDPGRAPPPDDARTVGFWRTVPGVLTAIAAVITAVAGLVVALNQAGVFARDGDGETGAAPAAPSAAIDGRWRARVDYPWDVTQEETFELRVEGERVLGRASFLGVPRAIEDGTISAARVEFTTRAEELSGGERRQFQNRYDGLVTPRGIQFELRDTRGNPPVEFTARRVP